MTVVCCVCRRVRHNGAWVEEEVPADELPSHGYCPECAAQARVELALLGLRDLNSEDYHPRSAAS